MPIRYPEPFYTNKRLQTAEQKILDWFEGNKYTPVSKEFLLNLINENSRTLERVMTKIRNYDGYSVVITKRGGVTRYQVVYNANLDPWNGIWSKNDHITI